MKKYIITLFLAIVSFVANGQDIDYYDSAFESISTYEDAINCLGKSEWKQVVELGTEFKFKDKDSNYSKISAHGVIEHVIGLCVLRIEEQTKKDGIARDTSKLKTIKEHHTTLRKKYQKENEEWFAKREAEEKAQKQAKISAIEKDLFGW